MIEIALELNKQITSNQQSLRDQITRIFSSISQISIKALEIKTLEDGITNKLYKILVNQHKLYLLKIYGNKTELFINREQEVLSIQSLSSQGLCPPIYAKFQNGLVYGYTQGVPLKPQDLCDPKFVGLIANKLFRLHNAQVSVVDDKTPKMFKDLAQMLEKVNAVFLKEKGFKYSIDSLFEEIEKSKEKVEKEEYTIKFCHNDLLSGNIIYDEKSNEINFIDFEYSNYNYRGFDIANHFNEYSGFECDYEKLPKKDQRKEFYKAYDSQNIEKEVETFIPISHLYWGVWALLQAQISDIEFDYCNYAQSRIGQYYISKKSMWSENDRTLDP